MLARITLGPADREAIGAPESMEYDPRNPRLREIRELKRQCGMTFGQLADALEDGDLEAAGVVVWLALLRHKVEIRWDDLDLDFQAMRIERVETDPNPSAPTGAST